MDQPQTKTFSLDNFLLLTFGLSFLTEGIFLFFRQSFMNQFFHTGFMVFFFALIFLYSLVFNQIHSTKHWLENFSFKSAFAGFLFWLVLSPIFFFRFYQLLLIWRPLPSNLLTVIFLHRWKILPIIGAVYLIVLFLSYRSILVPKYLKYGKTLRQSFVCSCHLTKRSLLGNFVAFLLIPLLFLGIGITLKIGFIWVAQFTSRYYSAMALLLLYRFTQDSLLILFFLYLASFKKKKTTPRLKNNTVYVWLAFSALAYFGIFALHYHQTLQTTARTEAVTISHRGVSGDNELQNSLAALTKTNQKFQPDLVEMDVQETADHQLVVIHDEDLTNLAGKDLRIDGSSWDQLKKIRLTENGYHSKITLFTDYLKTANELNQKLLIELKVTGKTKNTIVQRLLPLKDQLTPHELQSMDLTVANQLKQAFPSQQVGYILPFDLLGSPENTLDFVNIEARTANSDLIQKLQKNQQNVYIWSANSQQQTDIFMTQPINGILSDNLSVFTKPGNPLAAKTASIIQLD